MTVRLETKINRYIGHAGDTKPEPGQPDPADITRVLLAGDVPVGSTFMEEDTEDLYRWNGREWGKADNRTVRELKTITGVLGDILENLNAARTGL